MAVPGEIRTTLDAATLAALTEAARRAAENAHAPYSKFRVGAAVLDEHGALHAGCNVENASYGLTVCAERHAVGAAVVAGARVLRAVVVYTPTDEAAPPCGACRQVLAEFGLAMEVHLVNRHNERRIYRLGDLLPASFQFSPPSST